jgi:hypothetical protein
MLSAAYFILWLTAVLLGGRAIHKLLDLCFGKCEE